MERYNFVDLFCGAGGLAVGLEMAGFNCVFANDADPNSINTIRANHPGTLATCEPIQFLTESKIKEYIKDTKIHLVAGGPPCQGFSTIGKGNPDDPKNELFEHFVRVVSILRPNFVLFENVTGLIATKNESVLKAIIKAFQDIGYILNIKVLESQQYGVPQRRKRTIIVGAEQGRAFTFPQAEFGTSFGGLHIPAKTLGGALLELENYLDAQEAKDELHDVDSAMIKKEIDFKRIKCIPEGSCVRYQQDEEKYFPENLRLDLDWKTMKEGRLRENQYHRLSRKKPSPTINTENHHYYHPLENRRFTLREYATLQSFPLNYIFKGRGRAIKRQIGNAVPPLMARAIGREIYSSLRHNIESSNNASTDLMYARSKAFIYDGGKALTEYHRKRRKAAAEKVACAE